MQELEEHEGCGADELQPTCLKDSEEDSSDDDADSDNGTQHPRQRCALKRTLEEREIRNRPVPENVAERWLKQGIGRLAQALRVSLSQRGIDVTVDGSFEQTLQLLHNVEADKPRNTADLTIAFLSQQMQELFGIGETAVNTNLLYGELRAAVQSISVDFQHSGLPYAAVPELGDPEANLQQDLDALLAGQAGTAAQPFQQPARGNIPLSEHRTKGYTTLAFPVLFPFGVGDFSQPRRNEISWEQWSRHLQHYYDGRFSSHSRFPYFLLNTHEREVANRKAGLYIAEADKKLTVGDLRQMSRSQREVVAKRISKYGATLRNTPAFMGDRKKELQAMCEQVGDPNVRKRRLTAPPFMCILFACAPLRVPPPPAGVCYQFSRRHIRPVLGVIR